MIGTKNTLEEKLAHSLKEMAQDYNIQFALLFGSTVRQETTPLSDVDIGILFQEKNNYILYATTVADELQKEIHKEVDVIPLNTAPPALKYKIVTEGKLLYDSDDSFIRFYSQALREYFDFHYYLRQHTQRARRYLGVE